MVHAQVYVYFTCAKKERPARRFFASSVKRVEEETSISRSMKKCTEDKGDEDERWDGFPFEPDTSFDDYVGETGTTSFFAGTSTVRRSDAQGRGEGGLRRKNDNGEEDRKGGKRESGDDNREGDEEDAVDESNEDDEVVDEDEDEWKQDAAVERGAKSTTAMTPAYNKIRWEPCTRKKARNKDGMYVKTKASFTDDAGSYAYSFTVGDMAIFTEDHYEDGGLAGVIIDMYYDTVGKCGKVRLRLLGLVEPGRMLDAPAEYIGNKPVVAVLTHSVYVLASNERVRTMRPLVVDVPGHINPASSVWFDAHARALFVRNDRVSAPASPSAIFAPVQRRGGRLSPVVDDVGGQQTSTVGEGVSRRLIRPVYRFVAEDQLTTEMRALFNSIPEHALFRHEAGAPRRRRSLALWSDEVAQRDAEQCKRLQQQMPQPPSNQRRKTAASSSSSSAASSTSLTASIANGGNATATVTLELQRLETLATSLNDMMTSMRFIMTSPIVTNLFNIAVDMSNKQQQQQHKSQQPNDDAL